jgi:hypothetical protein
LFFNWSAWGDELGASHGMGAGQGGWTDFGDRQLSDVECLKGMRGREFVATKRSSKLNKISKGVLSHER